MAKRHPAARDSEETEHLTESTNGSEDHVATDLPVVSALHRFDKKLVPEADIGDDDVRQELLLEHEHAAKPAVTGWWAGKFVGNFSRWDALVILMTFGIKWEGVRADLAEKPLQVADLVGFLFFGPFWMANMRDRPKAPRETQLWTLRNCAIPLCYCMVGIFQGLSSASMNFYPLQLGATVAQQLTITTLRSLPASFKIIFGFLSDALPILGYRRKVYMLLGWLLASFSAFLLAVETDPSIPYLAFIYFFYGLGFWFADVMGDSLVAERAKLEPESQRGQLQSACYACRFYWKMVTICIAIGLYELFTPLMAFWILFALPLVVMLPAIAYLGEEVTTVEPVRHQLSVMFATVSKRGVYQTMAFVYLYNLFQVTNAAWNQFLKTAKGFTSFQVNSFLIPANVMLFGGVAAYKAYMLGWSWRTVYVLCTFLIGFFSLLQFVLIFDWNRAIGIPDYVFALGDEGIQDFAQGMQFLPLTIMMVNLCPAGSEGTSYAMFTTINNAALGISAMISSMLANIWDVDEAAFEDRDYSGMWRLTLLTSGIQLSALLFWPLLPPDRDALKELDARSPPSRVGGAVFLFVVFASMILSLIVAILNIVDPDWL